MRRADANIGDAVEFRDANVGSRRWQPGVIRYIGSDNITVFCPKSGGLTCLEPKHVRPAKTKPRKERERKSLRGAPSPGGAICARPVLTPSTKRGPALSRPKAPEPVRDQAFLAFVRTKACVFHVGGRCAGPVEAHHHGKHPLGRKTDDTRCVPLCRRHHREVTDDGFVTDMVGVPGGSASLSTVYEMLFLSVELLVEYDRMRRTR